MTHRRLIAFQLDYATMHFDAERLLGAFGSIGPELAYGSIEHAAGARRVCRSNAALRETRLVASSSCARPHGRGPTQRGSAESHPRHGGVPQRPCMLCTPGRLTLRAHGSGGCGSQCRKRGAAIGPKRRGSTRGLQGPPAVLQRPPDTASRGAPTGLEIGAAAEG